MVRLFKFIELPSFHIEKGEFALNRKRVEHLVGIAVAASISYLIYVKSGIQPIIENAITSLPYLGPLFQMNFIKVGVLAAIIYYIKDIID